MGEIRGCDLWNSFPKARFATDSLVEKGGLVKRLTSKAAMKRFVILMTLHAADCREARSPV